CSLPLRRDYAQSQRRRNNIKQKETKLTKVLGIQSRPVSVPKDLRFLCYLLLKISFSARPVSKGRQNKPRCNRGGHRSSSADGVGIDRIDLRAMYAARTRAAFDSCDHTATSSDRIQGRCLR